MPRIIIVLLFLPSLVEAEGRVIALLEYRAGVSSAPNLASGMAKQMMSLTSHRVIPPNEVRLRLGSEVDAMVARCKGDPACIAHIGRQLRCDEVILVGLSQLGDLILAIQRIDSRSGSVLTRMADSISPQKKVSRADLRAYLRRLLPASDFRRYGWIQVRTEAQGDTVYLDEAPRGVTPLAPLQVPAPGRYAIRVTRSGHEDFVARLDIMPDATVEVKPTLTRKTAAPQWYQHWWIWAIIGGTVAAAATGAVVASTSRSPSSVPAVVRLNP